MAGSRYSLIPKAFWQYLGPAYRGLDADLEAVESAVADGGGGLGSLGNPYINPADPASLPDGSYYVTYDPTNLTYRANRFTGGTVGGPVNPATSAATGTAVIEDWYEAGLTFTDQNTLIGNRAALVTAPADGGWGPFHVTPPGGHTEARVHLLMRMPALPAGASMRVLHMQNTDASLNLGDVILSGNGSWSCRGTSSAAGVLPSAGTPIRVALRVDILGRTVAGAVFAGDSTTMLGSPIVLTGADMGTSNLTFGNVNFGAVSGSGHGGVSYVLGAIRFGFGAGAAAAHLQPESTYAP